MKVTDHLSFATIFSINVCLAQVDIDNFGTIIPGVFPSITEPFVQSAISNAVQTEIAPSTTLTPQAPSSSAETTASSPQTSPTTSTSSLTSIMTSTHTPISSTTSISSSSSSTTSVAKPSSSKTSIAISPSPTASPGLKPSAKIGIGVGLPFGVIALAMMGFLTMRHVRHKEVSRLRHHGIVAAAGLYPVIDESENAGERDERNMIDVGNSSDPQGLEKDDVQEIQGTEIPPYSRELVGSPTVGRSDFPFSPGDV